MKFKVNKLLITILVIIFTIDEYSYAFEKSCPFLLVDKQTNENHFLDFYLNGIDSDTEIKELKDYGEFKKGLEGHQVFGDVRLEKLRNGISNKLNEIYIQVPEFAEHLYSLILNLNWELRDEPRPRSIGCYYPPSTPINLYNFHLLPLIQLSQNEFYSDSPRQWSYIDIISIWTKLFLSLKPKIQTAAIFHKVLNSYYNPQYSNYIHSDNLRIDIDEYRQRAQDTLGFLFAMNEDSSILNYMSKKDSECKKCGFSPANLDRSTPRIKPRLRYTWSQPIEYSFPQQQTVYIKYLSFDEFQKSKEICRSIEAKMLTYWPLFVKDLKTMNMRVLEEIKRYRVIHPEDEELQNIKLKNYAIIGDLDLASGAGRNFESSLTPLTFIESKKMHYQSVSYVIYNKENTSISIDWTKTINFKQFQQAATIVKEQYGHYLEMGQRCSQSQFDWELASQFKNISVN